MPPPEPVASRIDALLSPAPDAEAAARYLERWRQESPAGFERITASPAALRAAGALFSYSSFLSEFVLRDPESLIEAVDSAAFERVLSVEEFVQRLATDRKSTRP